MFRELWKIPAQATSLYTGPEFIEGSGRTCKIIMQYEDKNGGILSATLLFHDVEAYKCSFWSAIDVNMIHAVYEKLVDVGDSPWCAEVRKCRDAYHNKIGKDAVGLYHLAIFFDDGPLYEVVCSGFQVSELPSPTG